MPVKELTAKFKGHDIRVVNTWFSGAKLYIDSDLQDTSQELFSVSGNRPLLSSSLTVDETRHTVEVFMKAILTTKIKICVDGKMVAGELF